MSKNWSKYNLGLAQAGGIDLFLDKAIMTRLSMNKRIVLITACGSKKEEKPTIAGRLYKSPRIRYLYKKSKEFRLDFYILSAKYGLISGDEIVEPYDQVMDKAQCEKLKSQIRDILKNFDVIIYYKGGARKEYLECLEVIAKELNKKLITFGYGNMGDIGKLEEILNGSSTASSIF